MSKPLARKMGLEAAAMVAELIYQSEQRGNDQGWFSISYKSIEEATTLSTHLQKKALQKLITEGVMEMKKEGNLRRVRLAPEADSVLGQIIQSDQKRIQTQKRVESEKVKKGPGKGSEPYLLYLAWKECYQAAFEGIHVSPFAEMPAKDRAAMKALTTRLGQYITARQPENKTPTIEQKGDLIREIFKGMNDFQLRTYATPAMLNSKLPELIRTLYYANGIAKNSQATSTLLDNQEAAKLARENGLL